MPRMWPDATDSCGLGRVALTLWVALLICKMGTDKPVGCWDGEMSPLVGTVCFRVVA